MKKIIAPSDLSISPDGNKLAYIVSLADLDRNRNLNRLYVRDLAGSQSRPDGRLLMQAENVSQLHWRSDGQHVTVLTGQNNTEVRLVDVLTGTSRAIVSSRVPIQEYSSDSTGAVLAYTVQSSGDPNMTEQQKVLNYGFSVPFGYPSEAANEKLGGRSPNKLFIVDLGKGGLVTKRYLLDIDKLHLPSGRWYRHLALSPDGRNLVFQYDLSRTPESWEKNAYVKKLKGWGATPLVAALYDRKLNRGRLVFSSPRVGKYVKWSADSKAFSVDAISPVGTEFEKDDEIAKHDNPTNIAVGEMHIFAVDLVDGTVSKVSPLFVVEEDFPISWQGRADEMIITFDGGEQLIGFKKEERTWAEEERFKPPLQGGLISPVVGNGRILVGLGQSASIPPQLYVFNLRARTSYTATDLNPDFQHLSRGAIEPISWLNKYGASATGQLIYPVGYEKGRKYPVVINAYTRFEKAFICDAKWLTTAFPPQPLAAAGFLVLLANAPSRPETPPDFPGQLNEAFNWMSMIESAINLLVSRELTTADQIGLIGFSRTSWKTDFLLTHSNLKIEAASSADGGAFNYGSYWLWQDPGEDEAMMGGPPYGSTLDNWLRYAPAFNADHVQTPLLMEYTGENLDAGYEFFTALHRLGKPVELYSYPKGFHQLKRPSERFASLQRNVDWFRFWMQAYEGEAPPYDLNQYARWRELRKLQDAANAAQKPN